VTDILLSALDWIVYPLWATLLLAASLLVYVGLGGNFVVLALALVYALVTGFSTISWTMLGILLGLAVIGEVIESILGVVYVARKGATRSGVFGVFFGGLAGAVLGSPLMPVVGTVLGSFVGAFLGAVGGEYFRSRNIEPSLRIGGHAFVGKMAAILVKHALGVAMVAIILRATWPR